MKAPLFTTMMSKIVFLILSLYASNTNGDARYKCAVCDPMGDREWPYSCSSMEASSTYAHLKCKGNGCQYITKDQAKAGDVGFSDWCTYRNFTAPASSSTYTPVPECALITRGNGDAGTSRCEKKTATYATTVPAGISSRKLTSPRHAPYFKYFQRGKRCSRRSYVH